MTAATSCAAARPSASQRRGATGCKRLRARLSAGRGAGRPARAASHSEAAASTVSQAALTCPASACPQAVAQAAPKERAASASGQPATGGPDSLTGATLRWAEGQAAARIVMQRAACVATPTSQRHSTSVTNAAAAALSHTKSMRRSCPTLGRQVGPRCAAASTQPLAASRGHRPFSSADALKSPARAAGPPPPSASHSSAASSSGPERAGAPVYPYTCATRSAVPARRQSTNPCSRPEGWRPSSGSSRARSGSHNPASRAPPAGPAPPR